MVATAPDSRSPMTVQSSVAETATWRASMRRSRPPGSPGRRKKMPGVDLGVGVWGEGENPPAAHRRERAAAGSVGGGGGVCFFFCFFLLKKKAGGVRLG